MFHLPVPVVHCCAWGVWRPPVGTQHWRPTIDRSTHDPEILCPVVLNRHSSRLCQPRLVHANLVSSRILSRLSRLQPRLVYVNHVSLSVILISSPTSSRPCQPRLVHVNLVSSMSTSSLLCQSRLVQVMQVSYFLYFSPSFSSVLRCQIYFRFILFCDFL